VANTVPNTTPIVSSYDVVQGDYPKSLNGVDVIVITGSCRGIMNTKYYNRLTNIYKSCFRQRGAYVLDTKAAAFRQNRVVF
jgi:fructose-1-phosphate kinase PfkB-like protein